MYSKMFRLLVNTFCWLLYYFWRDMCRVDIFPGSWSELTSIIGTSNLQWVAFDFSLCQETDPYVSRVWKSIVPQKIDTRKHDTFPMTAGHEKYGHSKIPERSPRPAARSTVSKVAGAIEEKCNRTNTPESNDSFNNRSKRRRVHSGGQHTGGSKKAGTLRCPLLPRPGQGSAEEK